MTRTDPLTPASASTRPTSRAHAGEVAAAAAVLSETGVLTLQAEWRRLYRTHPPKKLSRDLLALAVGWKLQAQARGGLSGKAARELAELAGAMASGSDLPKARRVSFKPGARLIREWGGQTHEVLVVERGHLLLSPVGKVVDRQPDRHPVGSLPAAATRPPSRPPRHAVHRKRRTGFAARRNRNSRPRNRAAGRSKRRWANTGTLGPGNLLPRLDRIPNKAPTRR